MDQCNIPTKFEYIGLLIHSLLIHTNVIQQHRLSLLPQCMYKLLNYYHMLHVYNFYMVLKVTCYYLQTESYYMLNITTCLQVTKFYMLLNLTCYYMLYVNWLQVNKYSIFLQCMLLNHSCDIKYKIETLRPFCTSRNFYYKSRIACNYFQCIF